MDGTLHFSFTVSDLEKSLQFYQGILGLELLGTMERQGEEISRLVGLANAHLKIARLKLPDANGMTLELIEYVSPRGTRVDVQPCNPGTSHLCFLVQDIDSAYIRLREKGVRFRSEPVTVTSGMNTGARTVYFSDPDGIPLEMFQRSQSVSAGRMGSQR
jgi:catechol 2,3-dioxygenase-like lactoylglutathione lyase family enzyme